MGPQPDAGEQIVWILAGGTVIGLAGLVVTGMLKSRSADRGEIRQLVKDRSLRLTWRMPPLSALEPIQLSLSRRVWMAVLRGYLVVAVGMVLVRVIQLALSQG